MDPLDGTQDRSMLATIVDPRVKLESGAAFRKLGSIAPEMPLMDVEKLSIPQVKSVAEYLKSQRKDSSAIGRLSLFELFSGSQVLLPVLEVPERDKKLEARIQKLRTQLANREYKKMTENVSFESRYKPEESLGTELRKMNAGMLAVLQFVITIAAAFAFGFIGVEVFMGVELELAVKLLLGIILSLIVGAAEFYFLLLNIDLDEKKSACCDTKKDS